MALGSRIKRKIANEHPTVKPYQGNVLCELWGPVITDPRYPAYVGAKRGTNNTGEITTFKIKIAMTA